MHQIISSDFPENFLPRSIFWVSIYILLFKTFPMPISMLNSRVLRRKLWIFENCPFCDVILVQLFFFFRAELAPSNKQANYFGAPRLWSLDTSEILASEVPPIPHVILSKHRNCNLPEKIFGASRFRGSYIYVLTFP
jgi:hypothetical protein